MDAIYKGKLDFRNGAWVEAVSKHSPHAYKSSNAAESGDTEFDWGYDGDSF